LDRLHAETASISCNAEDEHAQDQQTSIRHQLADLWHIGVCKRTDCSRWLGSKDWFKGAAVRWQIRPLRSKPDRGAVTSFVEVINQASEVVMTFKVVNIIAKRSPES